MTPSRPALGPESFASSVLRGLGIHQTPGAVRALVGWMKAEGGHWHNDAKYNPLNTTQPMPGAGNTGSQGNIKVYRDWNQGVQATVKTLENGRYQPILHALAQGDPNRVAQAIGQTPWGTSAALVQQTIARTPEVRGAQPLTAAPRSVASASPTPVTPATPAVDNSAARGQLVNQFLNQHGADPLDFAMGIRGLQDTPGTPVPTPRTVRPAATASPGSSSGGASNALQWAAQKIGNKETGPNSGGLASYANQRFGMSNAPWCAMFTSLAVTKGGAPSSARTASVAQVLQKAQAGDGYVKGFIPHAQARPGDLIAFGTRHIGMVESVDGHGRVTMIAGNDSNQVQRRPVLLGADATIVRPAYGHK